MARLSNAYFTPFEVFASSLTKCGVTPIAKLDAWLFPYEHALFENGYQHRHFTSRNMDRKVAQAVVYRNRPSFYYNVLKGGLNPLSYLMKDLRDVVKPYKSPRQFRRDCLQPFRGLGNILRGVLNPILIFFGMVIGAIYLLINVVVGLRKGVEPGMSRLVTGVGFLLSRTLAQMIESCLSIFTGILQVVFTLPTYLIKIPLRVLLTPKDEQGHWVYPKVCDNAGVKTYMSLILKFQSKIEEQSEKALESGSDSESIQHLTLLYQQTYKHMRSLHYKVLSAINKGQPAGRFFGVASKSPDQVVDYLSYIKNINSDEPQSDEDSQLTVGPTLVKQ